MKLLIPLAMCALIALSGVTLAAATEVKVLKAGIGLNADTPQGRGL